ncbi:hypothetical protein [Mucilaginibacter paludis]|nr:hypothetical protein [Mucilaginibacter paludis]
MNKYEILKKVGIIIKELQDQYEYAEQNKEDINDLELELFVANANFLTDHIEILRKLNTQQTKALPESKATTTPKATFVEKPLQEARYFEPVVQPAPSIKPAEPAPSLLEFDVVEERKTNEPVTPVVKELEFEPVIRHELIPEETVSDEEETNANEEALDNEELTEELSYTHDEAEQPDPVIEPAAEAHPQNEILISQPEPVSQPMAFNPPEPEKPLTINQLISAQLAGSRLASQMELQPIKDLKSAINLNDKLLFVRDLFNGYSMAYSEAIEILNRFNKFEEADQFLKLNYYVKNNWEAKQSSTDKFYDLLKRRFVS